MSTAYGTSITSTLTSSDVLRTKTIRISLQIVTTQFKQLTRQGRHIWIDDNYFHLSAAEFEKWCVFKVVECRSLNL